MKNLWRNLSLGFCLLGMVGNVLTSVTLTSAEVLGEDHARARVYKKEVKVLNDEMIAEAMTAIKDRGGTPNFCASVHEDELVDSSWSPNVFIERTIEEPYRRSYEDILADLSRIFELKGDRL